MRILTTLLIYVFSTQMAAAFCGFYVAKADGELFNEASKVVYVRNKNRSVITMSSDYQGDAKDFAMIIPTPKVLRRDQIKTVKTSTIDHLDAYSAPRLVEYFDKQPKCGPNSEIDQAIVFEAVSSGRVQKRRGPRSFGVTVKAEYAVGIYDIVILKAKQSDGLTAYLTQEGYNLPNGAEKALTGYIDDGMKFFVARVNLKRHNAAKKTELEPLQISFRSKNFMLPIQLGKVNAKGPQDVLAMFLTNTGQVETENYPTKKIPTDAQIPVFVKKFFGEFYKATFDKVAKKSSVVMEYAWDMAWCDPCAADPLSKAELKELGVNWLKGGNKNAGEDVFVTRLHMRYDAKSMKNDPVFKHTENRQNFQGRYILNHPYIGELNCERGREYLRHIKKTHHDQATVLRKLTSWKKDQIDSRIRQSLPAGYF